MNRIFKQNLLLIICAFLIFSCKKKEATEDTVIDQLSAIRPLGQSLDEPVFETIGPSGGTIQSADGQITIEIPAGALTQDRYIGIQPITNTAVSGIGRGYRLSPHGKIFEKDVTIRFNYGKAERRISSNKALEIVYQNEKGEWIVKGGSANDPVQKTISVQTNHFSDWAFIASMELSPVIKTAGLNETVKLKALRYMFSSNDDDFVVPLTVPEAGTGEPMLIEREYIVKWTLNGPGNLQTIDNQAVYLSPSSMPANKTVTITLELKVHGRQVLLISTIYLVDEGIDISIDGGHWKTYSSWATKERQPDRYSLGSLRTSADIPQIVFMWPVISGQKANGIYAWSMLNNEEHDVVFTYATPDLQKIYTSVYEDQNGNSMDSGGFISVEEIEQNGKKYITGMFAIDNAGVIESATSQQVAIGNVMGTFKVPRSW